VHCRRAALVNEIRDGPAVKRRSVDAALLGGRRSHPVAVLLAGFGAGDVARASIACGTCRRSAATARPADLRRATTSRRPPSLTVRQRKRVAGYPKLLLSRSDSGRPRLADPLGLNRTSAGRMARRSFATPCPGESELTLGAYVAGSINQRRRSGTLDRAGQRLGIWSCTDTDYLADRLTLLPRRPRCTPPRLWSTPAYCSREPGRACAAHVTASGRAVDATLREWPMFSHDVEPRSEIRNGEQLKDARAENTRGEKRSRSRSRALARPIQAPAARRPPAYRQRGKP